MQCIKMKNWFTFKWNYDNNVLVLVMIQAFILSISATDTRFYKAAVVEYSADRWNGLETLGDTVLRNARRYSMMIEKASNENCDIIVFPELGLTGAVLPAKRDQLALGFTFLPSIEEESIPCERGSDELAEHLRELSCAAKKFKIYSVVNLYEKKKCDKTDSGCPTDGLLFYNTNIVFDRKGKIIAKYHKFNLFRENRINGTSSAELVTFDTDFGVKFGMFICFDILFPEPASAILEKTGVKNIIYPTAWFSEIPFISAVQTQASYSYLHNVNLLASGYNWPESGHFGSGIFAGVKGPIVQIMPDKTTTKLLIATLSSDPTSYKNFNSQYKSEYSNVLMQTKIIPIHFNDDFFVGVGDRKTNFYFHEDFSRYTTEILVTDRIGKEKNGYSDLEGSHKFTYDQNQFKCQINIEWIVNQVHGTMNRGPVYRLVAYKGERSYVNVRTVQLEVCAVIACRDEDLESCGYLPDFETRGLTNITSISISTSTPMISSSFPRTLDKNLLALLGDEISFTNNIDHKTVIQSNFMVLEKPRNDLIAFGIYKS